MGLRAAFRGFLRRLAETDESRLQEEVLEWAETVPNTNRIKDLPRRKPVRTAGVVTRLIVKPVEGLESLEAVVTDGTGEVIAAWMGRVSIPGLVLGTRLVLEGVVGDSPAGPRLVNPRYEFA